MKRSKPRILRGMDAGSETPAQEVWEKYVGHEFGQILCNTGRIEQLEAGQADLSTSVRQILKYLQSSKWATKKSPFPKPNISWQEVAGAVDTLFDVDEDITIWERAKFAIQPIGISIDQITRLYNERLSKISKLFSELETDFDDVPRRIARCSLLEEELATLENSLEDEETEHLAWCVSLIRDVLDYNRAEDFTEIHLGLLEKAVDLMCDKGPACNKEDYQKLHKEFLEAGLALIPTTQKAIDKYGQ